MSHMSRLYVLCRLDLQTTYAAVQGGHAVAQHLIDYPDRWRNQTLIYLGVKNEEELLKWRDKLIMKSIPYSLFREPDLNNDATALAVALDTGMFDKLPLL